MIGGALGGGLPRPLRPGEVAWHFILPQAVQLGGTPTNVFDELRVVFQSAGLITLTAFGPPTAAHAYVFTPIDDTLLAGNANIGREIGVPVDRYNDAQFNLSHTGASSEAPTTSTSSTTTTISSSSTTTTTTSPTIPTVRTSTATWTSPTSTGDAVGPASTSQLPGTGGDGGLPVAAVGLATLVAGGVLALAARRWNPTPRADDA